MRESLRKLLSGHPDPYGAARRIAHETKAVRGAVVHRAPGAIAYLRLSPRGQDEPRHGLEAQRDAIEAWCAARGLPIVLWATDRDVSGDSSDRPALVEALHRAARGTGTVLVVAKRDRLARDPVVGAILTRAIERAGMTLASVDGVGGGSSAADELVRAVVDAASAYELRRIRERTTEALAAKKRRGEKVGGRPPYGYRRARDGVHLEAEPKEQEILRFMRELRRQGYGWTTIARALAEAGYTSRTGVPFISSELAKYVRRGERPLEAMGYSIPLDMRRPPVGR